MASSARSWSEAQDTMFGGYKLSDKLSSSVDRFDALERKFESLQNSETNGHTPTLTSYTYSNTASRDGLAHELALMSESLHKSELKAESFARRNEALLAQIEVLDACWYIPMSVRTQMHMSVHASGARAALGAA